MCNDIKKAVLYGLAVWAIPFITAMTIFPFRTTDRVLFESIMPVSIAISLSLFASIYMKDVKNNFIKESVYLGLVFVGISIAIDLLMFMWAFPMPLTDYIKDIGITYLMIPAITIGYGYLLEKRKSK